MIPCMETVIPRPWSGCRIMWQSLGLDQWSPLDILARACKSTPVCSAWRGWTLIWGESQTKSKLIFKTVILMTTLSPAPHGEFHIISRCQMSSPSVRQDRKRICRWGLFGSRSSKILAFPDFERHLIQLAWAFICMCQWVTWVGQSHM